MWKLKKQDEPLSDTTVIGELEKIRVGIIKKDDEKVQLKFEEMTLNQMRLFTNLELKDALRGVL